MKLNRILLILFILFACTLNFLPHLNYQYPLHVDEWVHFQYSNNLSNNAPLYFGQAYQSLEEGFHVLLAVINSIGVPYVFMFRFFSILFTALICLGVFVLTRKIWNEKAGLFAVLFIALLQSSVIILGPVFLVPMALGLFLMAIGLYLVKIKSNLWFLILAFLFIMHPPTALAFFVLINISFLLDRKGYFRNIGLQILAFLIALPLYIPIFIQKGGETINALSFTSIIPALYIPHLLGWFILAITLIGIYFSFENKKPEIALFAIALLILIFIFYQFKVEVFIPYARALMYLFLIFAVAFGIGCEKIIKISKSSKLQVLLGIILVLVILAFALPAKIQSNNYIYHIVDEKDASAFNWIKQNTAIGSIAVLDPWKANAFTSLAERTVYSRIVQGPNKIYETKNNEIHAFFKGNCTNMMFLEQNNISLVYGNCNNSALKEIYPNVYLRN